ncbi:MAG: hypothetical protein GY768_04540 [Planctomycetaceae bacterium]|nr:hypothetical protein [Planctomycetaceae bacterium]
MSLYEILTVVSCVTSTLTMIIVSIAILPHLKTGLAVVRDAVLWASLVLVLALVGWLGLRQFVSSRAEAKSETAGVNRQGDSMGHLAAASSLDSSQGSSSDSKTKPQSSP